MSTSKETLPASAPPADPAIISFFDRRAADYDREYHDRSPGGYALRIRRRKVLDLFDQPGGNVLDVGCGPGVMAAEILSRRCRFWGVDPSPKMIEICRNRFACNEQASFLDGCAERLPLPSGFFDAVLCMGVMDSVKDGRQGIREMLRVLKPGGTLIVTFTNISSPYAWWKNFVFYPLVTRWHAWRARRGGMEPGRIRSGKTRALYSRKAAGELLRSEGAYVVEVKSYYYNLVLSPLDEIFPATALWLTRKLEETDWPTPDGFAAGMIVKAKKI
jgi:ubiquinone/menaquinone biosynthesis C-methylase UbiE